MRHDHVLTMYKASGKGNAPSGPRSFARIDEKPLSQWYAAFDHLASVAANEALFGTLTRAAEHGHAAAVKGEDVYLFFDGNHPALEMRVPDLPGAADLSTDGMSDDDLDRELGRLRIAYSPSLYQGFFIRGDGASFEPDNVGEIPYNATTREALAEIARWGFEECVHFFGPGIAELSPPPAGGS